jgi:hypothetical protein
VAAVAVCLSVDNEAAQSHQAALLGILPFEIQRDWSYCVTELDELILVTTSIVLGLHAMVTVYGCRQNNRG